MFDPRTGPTVVHQVPEGSVATRLSTFPDGSSSATNPLSPTSAAAVPPTTGSNQTTDSILRSTSQSVGLSSTQVLFDFSSVLEFVIPKPELCGHLITKATRTSKILGFPVRCVFRSLVGREGKLELKVPTRAGSSMKTSTTRIIKCSIVTPSSSTCVSSLNEMQRSRLLNLWFARRVERFVCSKYILSPSLLLHPHPTGSNKLPLSRTAQESSSLLSSPPPTFSMGHLVEQLFMDLNNFAESSIRIHDTNLELFLSPFYANPKSIDSWDVPIAIAALDEMKHPSWDVTLYKVSERR